MKTPRFCPLVFAGAVVAFPVSVAAQSARHAYDVTSYDLNIHPNFATGHISLRVRTTIQRGNDTDTFRFALSPRYQDVSVRVNGRPVALMRSGNTIAVSNPLKASEVVLEFMLAGKLGKSDDEERDAIEPDSLFLLWSDRFYPVDYTDWAMVRTAILLPNDMPVIAPGVETSATRTSAGTWHIFESRTPAVKFSVLADRLWIRQTSSIGRLQMTTLLHPEVASLAPALHRTSADIVRFFTHLHGYYPADAFAFVTVRGMFARRAFSGFIGYEPGYLTRTMQVDGYDAHETSLLWWGTRRTGKARERSNGPKVSATTWRCFTRRTDAFRFRRICAARGSATRR